MKIKILPIYSAPSGCLQYYTGLSGIVTSFNYDESANPRFPDIGTRQMANTKYGVCVRMAMGYCSIEWSQVDTSSFTVSGDTGSVDTTIIGKIARNCFCKKIFKIISKGYYY